MAESVPSVGDDAPLRPWDARAVEDEAEEGLLLAEYATRMRLKNRIIVDTMTAAGSVDAEAWADEARLVLGRLRIEAEQSTARMARERDVAELADGRARHEHDYRSPDAANLDRRRRVYRLVARRLLRWENDAARVAELLDAARVDAAEEMGRAIQATVDDDGTDRVEDAALLRERLLLVTLVDLPALQRAVRGEPVTIPVPEVGRLRPVIARVRLRLRRLRDARRRRTGGRR